MLVAAVQCILILLAAVQCHSVVLTPDNAGRVFDSIDASVAVCCVLQIIQGYKNCLLTPNIAEFGRLAAAVGVELPGNIGVQWQVKVGSNSLAYVDWDSGSRFCLW